MTCVKRKSKLTLRSFLTTKLSHSNSPDKTSSHWIKVFLAYLMFPKSAKNSEAKVLTKTRHYYLCSKSSMVQPHKDPVE